MQTDIQSIKDYLKNQPQAECQSVNALTVRNQSGNSSYTRPQYYPRANVRPGDRTNFNQNDKAQRQNNPGQYSQQYANVFHNFDIHEELSTMVSQQDVSLWDFLPSEIKEMIWKYKLRLEKQELERATLMRTVRLYTGSC